MRNTMSTLIQCDDSNLISAQDSSKVFLAYFVYHEYKCQSLKCQINFSGLL